MSSKQTLKLIHEKLPFKDQPEDYKIINDYWNRFDSDKKGVLFLKDVEVGLLSDLGLPKLPNTWATIGAAFSACQRDIHGSAIKSQISPGKEISKTEFAYVLQYMQKYYCYWTILSNINTVKERILTYKEFEKAVHPLEGQGLIMLNPKELFSKIDTTGKGFISFEDFCKWVCQNKIQYKLSKIQEGTTETKLSLKDLINILNEKLPLGGTEADKQKLSKYWALFDTNKNKYLDLGEVQKGIKEVVKLPSIFLSKPLRIIIVRAFNLAKTKLKSKNKLDDENVSRGQFRFLLLYLKNFYTYWAIFNEMDENSDMRISPKQFQKAVPLLQSYGIPIPDVKKMFGQIDKNNSGSLDFGQFCDWITNYEDQLALEEK